MRRRIICVIATSISAVLFVFGAESMNMVDKIAPYLMALGVLVVALAILFSEDVWNFVSTNHNKSIRLLIRVGFCLILTVPTFLYFQNVVNRQIEKQANTTIFYGNITAGNEPNPPTISNVPKDAIIVMLGENVGVFMRKDQTYIFADQDVPLVSIGFDSNGAMLINADVYDNNNNQIVYIKNSVFQANQTYAFHPTQLSLFNSK
jgi:hypothetical protein